MYKPSKKFSLSTPKNSYEVVIGPSFMDGFPDQEEWLSFKKCIQYPETLAFLGLWQEKAFAAQGIPLRKDFSFEELVKFGRHLAIFKQTEDNRWLTTFCGGAIVEQIAFEPTGK